MLLKMIEKDLKRFLRDRSAWTVIIAMPIIIMTILGFALASMFNSSTTMDEVHIAVVKAYDPNYDVKTFLSDLKASPMGAGVLQSGAMPKLLKEYDALDPEKLFFEQFLGNKDVKKFLTYELATEDQAKALIKQDKIAGYILLPSNFKKDMTINLLTPFRNPVVLDMHPNPGRSTAPAIMKALVEGFTETMDAEIAKKNVWIEQSIAYNLPMDQMQQVGAADGAGVKNLDAIQNIGVKGSKPVDSKAYYAVAMMSMFLLFAAAMGGTWLLEEKEMFTYDRQLIAGYSKLSIAISKMVLIYLVVAVQITVLILYSSVVLGVSWGEPLNVVLLTLATVFGVGGLGILLSVISSIANSYQLTKIFESGVIQILSLFGGSYIPIEQLPSIIGTIHTFILNGVILRAYINNMMGYSLTELLPLIGAILLNGLVFSAIAIILFIRKEAKTDVAHPLQKAAHAEGTN